MSYVCMRAERWSAESCMSLCLFGNLCGPGGATPFSVVIGHERPVGL